MIIEGSICNFNKIMIIFSLLYFNYEPNKSSEVNERVLKSVMQC